MGAEVAQYADIDKFERNIFKKWQIAAAMVPVMAQHGPDTIVVMVDAYDVIMQAPPARAVEELGKLWGPCSNREGVPRTCRAWEICASWPGGGAE